MKLESTLPQQAWTLHLSPVTDVVLTLLIFFLLLSNLIQPSGVELSAPQTRFHFDPTGFAEARLLSVTAAVEEPVVYLDNRRLSLPEFQAELDKMLMKEGEDLPSFVIKADASASHGVVFQIAEAIQLRGMRAALLNLGEGSPPP
ncbi:MAG: biopolymer transporter ExbD [Verrucomicrobiota bacterium]